MAHFEKAFIATLFAPIVAFIACSRESAAPAVTDAAPAVVSAPTASASAAPVVVNEAKITRYKDESAMNVPVTVKHTPAAVITAMPKGDVVAQLKVGDAVTQLAERNGYYRVTFADPTNAKQLLSGWLDKFAFVDRPTPPKKKVPTCTGDLILVMQGDMRCAKTCSDDAECPGGDCEVAAILHADGEPPENHASTTVCTPKAAPAPSASACPAGLVRIVAAGKPGGACVEACGSICSGGEDPVEATLLKDDGTPGAKVNVRPQASKPKLAQCGAGFARIVVSGQPGGACRLMCGSVCGGGENPVEATLLKDDGTPGGKVSVHP